MIAASTLNINSIKQKKLPFPSFTPTPSSVEHWLLSNASSQIVSPCFGGHQRPGGFYHSNVKWFAPASTDGMRRTFAMSGSIICSAKSCRTSSWNHRCQYRRVRALGVENGALSLWRSRSAVVATRRQLHHFQDPACSDGRGVNRVENSGLNEVLDSERVPDVPEAVLGPRGTARFLVNGQGIRLACYHWPVVPTLGHQALRGVVVLVHGYAVHLTFSFLQSLELDPPKPYDGSWIHRMNLAGYAVWGIDNQSCGRSEGVRSDARMYFERFEDLCSDVEQLIQVIKDHPLYVNLPLFMIGESMGGNVCLHVSQKVHPSGLLQGTVLLAPMIRIKDIKLKVFNRLVYPLRRLSVWLLGATAEGGSGSTNQQNALTLKQYKQDPLNYHGAAPLKVSLMTLQQCNKTTKALSEFNFPFYIIQSENDRVCDPVGAEMLYTRSTSKVKKISMLSDPDSYHFLSVEPMNLQVLGDILDWMGHQSDGYKNRDPPSGVDFE
eukprot:scaffold776_cov347-Pavlova_lutheri.AAC.55